MIYLAILILIAIYYYTTRNHDYWAKRNVKHDPPLPFFGNHFRNIMGIRSITEISTELYNKYPDEKVVGYYRGVMPELIIRDLDIVRDMLSADFNYFYKRGLGRDPDREPLLKNLFHVDGDSWKLLRQRLTQAFTTAKLKNMFPLIIKCTENLHHIGKEIVAHGGECDARELMARFTTEFIVVCGFGIETNSIKDESSIFRQLGKKILQPSLRVSSLYFLWELVPELRSWIKIFNPYIEKKFKEIVQTVVDQRHGKPSGCNDFIDLLLELESIGIIEGESIEKRNTADASAPAQLQIDLQVMVAQVFAFFVGGFETSSSATSCTLHQLAFHPDIQTKIQDEIDEVLSKHHGKLCYHAITEMRLLDMAFRESMRIFPVGGILNRECTKPYTIPKLGITINPGIKIIIPVQAIHLDPIHYDNPKEFRPERFKTDEANLRNKYAFMPYGEGPRSCIGSRLGQIQSLAGLAVILQNFTLEPCAASRRELLVDHRQNLMQFAVGGIPLKLKLRKP